MRCSLIIPAYNAERTIVTCLESVLNQSLSRDEYEVIVVDDGSTDNTPQIIRDYPVTLISQANQGPALARNRGANEAKGEILVFTDSDCELDFHFLERITSPIENDPEIVGVQGSYKTKQKEFMARFGQVEIETRYNRMSRNKYIDFIGTYAAAYKKEVFHELGEFDTGFPLASGEDTEFSYKLYESGYKMVFRPEAFVYHQHPSELRKYLKSKFYRGYWRIRLYRKHPAKTVTDSYTPQTLKFQVLSIPLLLVFTFLSFFNAFWLIPLFMIALLFIFFSFPFFRIFGNKGYAYRNLIPFIIFSRALFLFLGMVCGIPNAFLTGKNNIEK